MNAYLIRLWYVLGDSLANVLSTINLFDIYIHDRSYACTIQCNLCKLIFSTEMPCANEKRTFQLLPLTFATKNQGHKLMFWHDYLFVVFLFFNSSSVEIYIYPTVFSIKFTHTIEGWLNKTCNIAHSVALHAQVYAKSLHHNHIGSCWTWTKLLHSGDMQQEKSLSKRMQILVIEWRIELL